jgi:hypothetical protein
MFAPLPGAGRRRQTPAVVADEWRPILPVSDDAPSAPQQHYRHGKPAGCWTYRDQAGKLLGYVLRFDLKNGGKEYAPLTFCQGSGGRREWRWKVWLAPRPLYGLDRLAQRPTAAVVVVEGEKAADAAAELLPDYVVVTSPNGAKSAGKADWSILRGRVVIIWPDNDEEGRTYAAAVAKALRGIAVSVKIASVPSGGPEKWDAADAVADGWDRAKATALINAAIPAGGSAEAAARGTRRGRASRPRQSDQLLDFLPEIELWHSPNREAFATIPIAGHIENWRVRSEDFSEWLSQRSFEKTGTVPSSQALKDTLRVMEAHAKHVGLEHPIFLRVGELDDPVFVDLGDAQWRAIEITPQGWRVIDRAPVKFVRSPHVRALPIPEDGGLIERELRGLMNVQDEADFKLIVGWLVGCFNPRGPYPILAINGEHGSAKSTLCRLLRRLTDPHEAEIGLPPRNEDDLIVAARNSHVLAFDNMSDIAGWLSDALCSLATGTGFGTREHYSNIGEIIFKGARPIMLNGIPDLGSRSDFGDRKIDVVLHPITEADRRAEAEYWREVDRRLPLIFGAILNAVASALRRRDEIPALLPQMADFAVWVSAAEPALGWDKGEFLAAYTGNRKAAAGRTLEADVLGEPVCRLVESEDLAGFPDRTADPPGRLRFGCGAQGTVLAGGKQAARPAAFSAIGAAREGDRTRYRSESQKQ